MNLLSLVRFFLFAVLPSCSQTSLGAKVTSSKWGLAKVSQSRVFNAKPNQLEKLQNHISAGSVCRKLAWCLCFCDFGPSEKGRRFYMLSSLVFNMGLVELSVPDPVKCWTNKTILNLIITNNVTVTGSAFKLEYPRRVASNIIDGVYGKDVNECFLSAYVPNPYLLIDLRKVQPISSVRLRGQNSENIAIHFEMIEVRVGNVTSDGAFGGYQLMGTFQGPTKVVDLEISIGGGGKVWFGRFVSIQMMVSIGFEMQVCHVEIY